MSDDGGIEFEFPLTPTEGQLREMRKENMKDRTEALKNPETYCYLKGWSNVDMIVALDESFTNVLKNYENVMVDKIKDLPLDSYRLIYDKDDEIIFKAGERIGLALADINDPSDKKFNNRSRFVKISESLN